MTPDDLRTLAVRLFVEAGGPDWEAKAAIGGIAVLIAATWFVIGWVGYAAWRGRR